MVHQKLEDQAETRPMTAPSDERGQADLEEGERLLDVGRFEEAEPKLRAAVAARPDSAYVHNKLGVCLARQGRLEEARQQFSEAVRLDPTFAPAHSNLGNLYGEEDRIEDAINAYLEALRHDPDYHIAHHNLGAAYRKQGRIAEAVSHLKKANRLEKESMRREARESAGKNRWAGTLLWVAIGALLYLLLRGN